MEDTIEFWMKASFHEMQVHCKRVCVRTANVVHLNYSGACSVYSHAFHPSRDISRLAAVTIAKLRLLNEDGGLQSAAAKITAHLRNTKLGVPLTN
jgi:hypothetical protein